jgi:Ser-tRNA(Ala) deacylase AlaX
MKLAYWITPALRTLETKVTGVKTLDDGRQAVTLEQTIFYAQGGGQPADRGKITKIDDNSECRVQNGELHAEKINSAFCIRNSEFVVTDVRFVDDDVYHYGTFVGDPLKVGDSVVLSIDWERRWLNTRLHSAAHLLDAVMKQQYPDLKPLKSYHFPEGPYVEYQCLGSVDTEKMKAVILQSLVAYENAAVPVSTDTSNLNHRVVTIEASNAHTIPCGGTHVNSTADIGAISIRKIKIKNEVCRISYALTSEVLR